MLRIILFLIILCLPLLFPTPGFSAYNDVTLTTDTVIAVGGVDLNVSGSSAVLESITVTADDFSVTILPGSSLTVVSSDRRRLVPSIAPNDFVQTSCTTGQSSIVITADPDDSSKTITVTPSSVTCSLPIPGSGGGRLPPPTPSAAPSTPEPPAPPLGTPVGLTTPQAQSVLDLLTAFEVPLEVIAQVRDILSGISPAPPPAPAISPVFERGLGRGMVHEDIRRLQRLLNADPDTYIAADGPGSPGNETEYFGTLTERAVQKFQIKHGIVSSGTPDTTGFGRVGPQTAAKLKELFGAER